MRADLGRRFALIGVFLVLAAVSARAQDYATGYLFASSGSVSGNVGVGTNAAGVLLDARGGSINIEQSPVEVFLASTTQTSAVTTSGTVQTWTAVPGTTCSFTLPRTMTVRMHATGGATGVASATCGMRFVVDTVGQGDTSWGNVIFYTSTVWFDFTTQIEMSLGAGTHTVSAQLVSNYASGCIDNSTAAYVQMWMYGR